MQSYKEEKRLIWKNPEQKVPAVLARIWVDLMEELSVSHQILTMLDCGGAVKFIKPPPSKKTAPKLSFLTHLLLENNSESQA